MVVVTRENFEWALKTIKEKEVLSLDTETTGLKPYQGSKLFSIIIATSEKDAFYFNFWDKYPGLSENCVLDYSHILKLKEVFKNPNILWFMHNATYDLAILVQDDISLSGTIHCTQTIARLEYNDHMKYDLSSCLERIGLKKDDKVEEWIKDNKAWEWIHFEGKKTREKEKFYYKVPWDIIVPYGLKDALGTYSLGMHQISSMKEFYKKKEVPEKFLTDILNNERRLTKTIFEIEKTGCLINKEFTKKAYAYEKERAEKELAKFKELTGKEFKASSKIFSEVLLDDKGLWQYTEKGNPSFRSDVIENFKSLAATCIKELRDAKAKMDFYTTFLHYADTQDRVHPNFVSSGTVHGRFSSSKPNFQNLKNDEDEDLEKEFVVRRCVIPTPGYILCSIDYSTMEYRFMLNQACTLIKRESPLARKINAGEDYHKATADLVKEITGVEITRSQAKTSNFLTLYGGGSKKLATGLGITENEAHNIRSSIKKAAPEISAYIKTSTDTSQMKEYVRNWLGRILQFPKDYERYYKAANYLIAGGCADIVKVAMNQIDDLLKDKKSRMILTIHDEIVFEVHESEMELIKTFKHIMENAFPSKYVPLKCQVYVSNKSLADIEGYETGN